MHKSVIYHSMTIRSPVAISKSAGDADRYQSIGDTFVQLCGSGTSVVIAPCRPMQSDVRNEEQRKRNMKIVMVLTSHDTLGNTGLKTGFWRAYEATRGESRSRFCLS